MAAEGHEHSILYAPVNAAFDGAVRLLGLEERYGALDVPDHVVMSFFVVAVMAALFIPMSRSLRLDRPGYFQQLLELIVEKLSQMLDDIIGEGAARRYLPLIGSFAVFIFLCNFAGSFFFLQPPTQNTNVTFALSITAWVIYHLMGFREHGLPYLKQFLGPVPSIWLMPLMLPLEIISHSARALSLGLRLYGNIFGEHLALGIFVGLVPFLVPLPLMALGLFAAFVQTFIFIILTTIYIAGAEASEH